MSKKKIITEPDPILRRKSDNIENIDSTAPDAPRRCPVDDFVEDINKLSVSFKNSFFTELNSISSPSGVDVPCAFI